MNAPASPSRPMEPVTVNGEEVPGWLFSREFSALWQRRQDVGALPKDSPSQQQLVNDALQNAIERLLLMRYAQKTLPAPAKKQAESWRKAWLQENGGRAAALRQYNLQDAGEARLEDIIRLDAFYDALIRDQQRRIPEPAEEEIKALHAAQPDRFCRPETVRFQQVFRANEGDPLSESAALLQARDWLLRGAPLARVVARFGHPQPENPESIFATLRVSPDPAWQEVADVAFALQPGQVSDMVQTHFGRHVLKLVEHTEEVRPPLDQIRDVVAAQWKMDRTEAALGELVDRLLGEAVIRGLPGADAGDAPAPSA